MLKKATSLSAIPDAFPLAPLTNEDFPLFYVTIDCERDSCLSRVKQLTKTLERDNAKIFFAGHRGSGKSTELNRLKAEINENSFVVQFSVMEELDINDLTYIDLVMVAMERLAEAGVTEGLINQDAVLLQKIYDSLSSVTKIRSEETGYMLEVGAGLKADRGILSHLIGIIAEFKASVKAASSSKKEYRQEIEQRITILTANCNILINEIELELRRQNKRLLLIIEDIDKADTAKVHEIFYRHSGILASLNTRIIFTVSIFALNDPGLAASTFSTIRLPMLKIRNMDQTEHTSGYDAITTIVEKRADLSLFEDEVLKDLISNSGGVLRDLFEMIDIASNAADYANRRKVTKKDAEYAFNQLKIKYYDMIAVPYEMKDRIQPEALYDTLIEFHNSGKYMMPKDDTFPIFLSCLAIIEYNGEQWFDLHPAVKALLVKMGKI